MIRNELAFPMTEWMCAGCSHGKSEAIRNSRNCAPELGDISKRFINIQANIRAYLNYSLVHFRFYFILNDLLSFMYDLLFMTFQLMGNRVKDHVFFFNPKCEIFVIERHEERLVLKVIVII